MTNVAAVPEEEYQSPIAPERLAWGVLLMSFAVFCSLCAAITLGTYYFMFESSLRLDVQLQVGRGTVILRAPNDSQRAETDGRQLSAGTAMRTDFLSQSTINFYDDHAEHALIATVTLLGDTELRMRKSWGPRFDWSSSIYSIELDEFVGELDIYVAEDLTRELRFSIRTNQGVEARIDHPGRYVLEASETGGSLLNKQGSALLITPDRRKGVSVPVSRRGVYSAESDDISLEPDRVNLLENSTLRIFDPGDESGATTSDTTLELPTGWSCANVSDLPNTAPKGRYLAGIAPDGRLSFRLVRGRGSLSHGETRCEQRLGDSGLGLDVSNYNSLHLQMKLFIDYQSLSACGTVGSECPMMLQINFIDENGDPRVWRHGIYAWSQPGLDWPLRCDTCYSEHLRVYDQVWVTYDSGDLLTILPPEQQPAAITRVTFYASGHDYDVYVDEIALLARPMEDINAEDNTVEASWVR